LPLSVSVEADAAVGRNAEFEVPCCPDCTSSMGRWSGYRRFVREAATCSRVFVARARCSSCARTHVPLPALCVLKRLDAAEVIATVVETVGAGVGAALPLALHLGRVRRELPRCQHELALRLRRTTAFHRSCALTERTGGGKSAWTTTCASASRSTDTR
jgi:hypothetical protein